MPEADNTFNLRLSVDDYTFQDVESQPPTLHTFSMVHTPAYLFASTLVKNSSVDSIEPELETHPTKRVCSPVLESADGQENSSETQISSQDTHARPSSE
jgi:hypothetical protein